MHTPPAMFLPTSRGQKGYTLIEMLVVVSITVLLASVGTAVYMKYIRKASSVETSQEMMLFVTATQQSIANNSGTQPNTLTKVYSAGYSPNEKVGIQLCRNWSNGAESSDGYMVRAYTKTEAGTVDATRPQYIYDSKQSKIPLEMTQPQIVSKFCSGEAGYTWPAGGTDNLVPAS